MSLFEADRTAERIPVSVLTGCLGSGKTTLLNALLPNPSLADTAVIVNEFGEIALDHLLMEAVDGEITVMASGCVCCTIRSDLETTLRDLLARAREGRIPTFKRVIVETTGLADPAPIVQMLLNNPLVTGFFRLDAVVSTVDTVNAAIQLDGRQPEPIKQLAMADRLILTKTDIADPADVSTLTDRLTALNPTAAQIEVVSGDISPERLFDAGLYDPSTKSPDVGRWLRDEALSAAKNDGNGHLHAHSRHSSGIESFALSFDEPLGWRHVNLWLAALRQNHGDKLLRVKGILNLDDEPQPVAIHGVQHVFHSPSRLQRWPDDDRRSRIVFITRNLDQETVMSFWNWTVEAA